MVTAAWRDFELDRFESYVASINLKKKKARHRDMARRDLIAVDIRATVKWLYGLLVTSSDDRNFEYQCDEVLTKMKKFLAVQVFPAFVKRQVEASKARSGGEFIKCHECLKEFIKAEYVINEGRRRERYPGCPVALVATREVKASYKVRTS